MNKDIKISGMAIGQYLAGLFNLDGQIRGHEYIDVMALLAGLRLAVGRNSDVHILPDALRAQTFHDQWHYSHLIADDRRFTIIPVFFDHPSHWTVIVAERGRELCFYYDSLKFERDVRAQLAEFILSQIQSKLGKMQVKLEVVDVPEQKQGWTCGMYVLETARRFFQDGRGRLVGDEWSIPVGSHGDNKLENRMISKWLRAIQNELGSPYSIRNPPIPRHTFATAEQEDNWSEAPNSQPSNATTQTDEQNHPNSPSQIDSLQSGSNDLYNVGIDGIETSSPYSYGPNGPTPYSSYSFKEVSGKHSTNTTTPIEITNHSPSQSQTEAFDSEACDLDICFSSCNSDTRIHSPMTSENCIEREESSNYEIFAKLRAIQEKITQKLKAHDSKKTRINGVTLLREFSRAMEMWLRDVSDEAIACEADLSPWRFFHYAGRVLYSNPVPPEGREVCTSLIKAIRAYESRWLSALETGEDADAISVPRLTAKSLASIIKNGEVVKLSNETMGYSADWLMKSIGSRFLHDKLSSSKQYQHLRHDGITQTDLNCTDEVWANIKPLVRRPNKFRSPRYFAPVPSLMYARNALGHLKLGTVERPDCKEEMFKSQNPDDLWVAFLSLPPKYRGFMKSKTPSQANKFLGLMDTEPTREEKWVFHDHWQRAISDGNSHGIMSAPRPTQPPLNNLAINDNSVDTNTPIDSLITDWKCEDFVKQLNERGFRRAQVTNKNIITVEDVVSILPGRRMTSTALYIIIENTHIHNEDATVIAPALLEKWIQTAGGTVDQPSLFEYFKPCSNEVPRRLVYILSPLSSAVEGLAVCQVTPTSCRTLSIGTVRGIQELESLLRSLFETISREGSAITFHDFDRIEIEVGVKTRDPKWFCRTLGDVSIALIRAVIESSSTGSGGLDELLGERRLYRASPKPNTLRRHSVLCLRISNQVAKNSETGGHYEVSGVFNDQQEGFDDPEDQQREHDDPNIQHDFQEDLSDSSSDSSSDSFNSSDSDDYYDGFDDLEGVSGEPQSGQFEGCNGMGRVNFTSAIDNMSNLDMNNDAEVEIKIQAVLSPQERAVLTITSEDESRIISSLERHDEPSKFSPIFFSLGKI